MQELKAKPRPELGKGVKNLRNQGFLPAVLYGEGVLSQPIAISFKDFEKAYKEAGESTLLKLEVDGKSYNVLIHDISFDPLRDHPIHADFYAVRMDKEIRATVRLEFMGESPAVKNLGGILIKVVQELEVEAFPQDLPHEIQINLDVLTELQSRILVKDIPSPKGVKILANADELVVLVEPPRSEEELKAELEPTPEAGIAEVKTEQELKREAKEVKAESAEVTTPEKETKE